MLIGREQELRELKEKSECLYSFKRRFYALFSKSGFSKELRSLASGNPSLLLFTLEEMY